MASSRHRPAAVSVLAVLYLLIGAGIGAYVVRAHPHRLGLAPVWVAYVVVPWLVLTSVGVWLGKRWGRASALGLHLLTPTVVGGRVWLDRQGWWDLDVEYSLFAVLWMCALHLAFFAWWLLSPSVRRYFRRA